MAAERKSKIKIEDLPRPEEELTTEQAEKLTGGAFSAETTTTSQTQTVTNDLEDKTYNPFTVPKGESSSNDLDK